ncbi:hypothetical protein GJ496_000829 [Pomphorhynchus laevis]|nr:hypothetical protein GJ496_000829 [Pomphorhynchus laevis]
MNIKIFEKFITQCDPQLILLIVDYMMDNKLYDTNSLMRLKFQLLELTERNDEKSKLADDLHLDENVVEKFGKRMQESKRTYASMYDEIREFTDIYAEETSEDSQLPKDCDLWSHLKTSYQLDDSILQKMYNLAQFSFKCGMLNTANSCLEICKSLLPQTRDIYLNCLWGKLTVNILSRNFKDAVFDIRRLNEQIDKMALADTPSSIILKQRSWLIHYSLFVYYRIENGLEHLVNFCLNDKIYLSTLQLLCPYLMHYITTAALITSDRKRNIIEDVIRLFDDNSDQTYIDPTGDLIKAVCINFDFNNANELLSRAEEAVANDFFMCSFVQDFMKSARSLVFENFCRLHHCVGIGPVSEQLDLNWDETEAYILELVKNGRLNAKIDSAKGNIVMEFNTVSPYETMMNKFRFLQIKLDAFTNNFEKRSRVY